MDRSTNKPLETAASQSKNLAASADIYSNVMAEDKANLEVWRTMENNILSILHEPNHKLKAKMARELSTSMLPKLLSLTDLFSKYPAIRDKYAGYGKIIDQLSSYMNASTDALQQSAIEYFRHLYPSADPTKDFTFFNKNEGVQVGQVLRINYLDETQQAREVCYYIKTHQNGSTSQGGAAGAVDLKELFVYKALENMHLGPKVHFFTTGMSAQNGFYIATRGFPFSKNSEKQKQKTFLTYQKFEQEKNLQSLVPTDVPTVSNVVHGLTMIDIISRIFKLSDVATNNGNFGFAIHGNTIKCKIIDFRVGVWDTYTYTEGLLKGFLAGNGTYNYPRFVGTALTNRLSIDKIAEAKAVIQDLMESAKFSNFYDAIQKAYEEIRQYANENNGVWVPAAALAASLLDLSSYSDAIKENFNTFLREVTERAAKQQLVLKG